VLRNSRRNHLRTLIVITTDKRRDTEWDIVTAAGISSLTTSKVVLFYVGISALEKSGLYLNYPRRFRAAVTLFTLASCSFMATPSFIKIPWLLQQLQGEDGHTDMIP
jgi:hypothetical protein